jgi:glutathione synthase/RimK-type ligase-like ATP-grasp enzyme
MLKSVVICTRRLDGHADRLCAEIELLGAKPVRINIEDIKDYSFEINSHSLGLQMPNGEKISSNEISSIFVRALPSSEDFKVDDKDFVVSIETYVAIQQESLFHDWLNAAGIQIPVINKFANSMLCMGKGYQHMLAKKIGLLTPDLYIGDDPISATNFVEEKWGVNEEICTKPVAHKTVLIDGVKSARFTEKFNRQLEESLSELKGCPLIFQNYVEKTYELRVTVIGNKLLACKISSQEAGGETAVDWRHYNIAKTPHEEYVLPDDIATKLLEFHKQAGLVFSAFDLIRTPEGNYIFLETNPTGQWLWLEDLVGLPICKTLASELVNPSFIN